MREERLLKVTCGFKTGLTRRGTGSDEGGETFCCVERSVRDGGDGGCEWDKGEIEGRFLVDGSETCSWWSRNLWRSSVVPREIGLESGLCEWGFLRKKLRRFFGFFGREVDGDWGMFLSPEVAEWRRRGISGRNIDIRKTVETCILVCCSFWRELRRLFRFFARG